MSIIKVSYGITAYNEEKAMPKLLKSIMNLIIPNKYELIEVIIVSSGSTDKTNDIIKDYQKKDERIILIEEEEKRGKPVALNKIIRSYKGDILIHSGADGILQEDSFYWLLKTFDEEKTSAVSGHPVPINPKNTLWGFGSYMLWEFHHLMLLNYPKKLSGELCAIKRTYLFPVPEKEGGDDIYLERNVINHNGIIKYEPKAIIKILGPQTLGDYYKQRRRVIGHIKKAEYMTKIRSPTTEYSKLIKILFKNISKFISPYAIPVMIVEFFARMMAERDIRKGAITSNWEIISTTKSL